jgi:hypothetical protein
MFVLQPADTLSPFYVLAPGATTKCLSFAAPVHTYIIYSPSNHCNALCQTAVELAGFLVSMTVNSLEAWL